MNEEFKNILSPIQIGPFKLRNRILISGHITGMAMDGTVSEQQAYYCAERAKGGVAMIITEAFDTNPHSRQYPWIVEPYRKESIPGMKMATDMIHEHDARVLAQLCHTGAAQLGIDSMTENWAPSAIPHVIYRVVPKEMVIEDIREVIDYYILSARNCIAAGYDGVEIHGAHGYLLHQFMSPIYNYRTDEYGGSLENRVRLTIEIIDAVREEIGDKYIMGIRISGDEVTSGGLTLKDMQEIAAVLENTGKLDYISVSMGNYNSLWTIIAPMCFPSGYQLYLPAGIKEIVDLPVFGVGRIVDPLKAEEILRNNQADMVVMTRAHIADPEILKKIKEGKADEIRSCAGCNQGCIGRRFLSRHLSCLQNPAAGREKELGVATLKKANTKKDIMVIGGGPAGMKAAEIAASRGHQVTLFERTDELGGQVKWAMQFPKRDDFGNIIRNLSQALEKQKVEIISGTEVTAKMVLERQPDAVVVATGSTPDRTGFSSARPDLPKLPGVESKHVTTVLDALQRSISLGENILIIDEEGHYRGLGMTDYLLEQDKKVELVCRYLHPGVDIVTSGDLGFMYQRILNNGCVLTPNTMVKAIEDHRVILFNIYNKEESVREHVDNVILAFPHKADNQLYRELKGKVKELHAIGDCLAPRRALEAIYEGNKVGRAL